MEPLLELLGILIAFSVLMLLLSLIVTSLVQTLQYAWRFRIRNLRMGLEDMLEVALYAEKARQAPGEDENGGVEPQSRFSRWIGRWKPRRPADPELRARAVKKAHEILTSPVIAQARMGWPRTFVETSWITREELGELMKRKGFSPIARREADRWFERFEANLEKTFLTRIRWLTVACAFGVAVLFQVDAFDTLRELSVNPQLRQQLSSAAPALLKEYQGEITNLRDSRSLAEDALMELEQEADEWESRGAIEEAIDRVAGTDPDRGDLLDEFQTALGAEGVGPDETTKAVKRYEELLAELSAERAERASELRSSAMGDLARFSLSLWGREKSFYWNASAPSFFGRFRPGRYIGVLVTAIFLSFGAPFWFEQLRNLVALRDQLEKGLKRRPERRNGEEG